MGAPVHCQPACHSCGLSMQKPKFMTRPGYFLKPHSELAGSANPDAAVGIRDPSQQNATEGSRALLSQLPVCPERKAFTVRCSPAPNQAAGPCRHPTRQGQFP